METKSATIKKLFGPERRFLVPIFQRGYVWTKAGQWEPLWRDIVDQALIVRKELRHPSRNARRHFLGAIVIGEDQNRVLRVSTSSVIDGQQRLTTLQVFLAALRDAVLVLEDKNMDRALLRLTDNEGDWQDADERFKVWPTNAYQNDLRRLMTAGSPEALSAFYPQQKYRKKFIPPRPPLVEAYFYFFSAIRSYLRGSDEWNVDAPASAQFEDGRAIELLEAVQSYLQIVTIELGADDDPQVIFETLNARGVDLEPSDLIRNFVFLFAQRNDEDPNDLYERFWKAFDETPSISGSGAKWWREKERQGRLLRERLDLFCFHYVTYRLNREIKIGHLFQEFRDWWEDGDTVFEESEPAENAEPVSRVASVELARIESAACDFKALVSPDRSSRFGVFASRVKRLDTTTVYPLVLWLAENRGLVDEASLNAILADVESYLVRRAVCDLTNKNYNQVFLALLRKLRKLGPPTHAGLRNELASLGGESTMWPNDKQFTAALIVNPIYSALGPVKTQMILEALDDALDDNRSERVVISTLSVEHVLPQSAELAHWPYPPAPSRAEGEAPPSLTMEDLRSRITHTVGNLTLVTQKLNSSVGRGPFAQKRPTLTGTSRLALNSYFQRLHDNDAWDELSILKRSQEMAAVACRIWPHPGLTVEAT